MNISATAAGSRQSSSRAITAAVPAPSSAPARATLLLPLGNFVVVQIEAASRGSDISAEGASCVFSGIKGCVVERSDSDGDGGPAGNSSAATGGTEQRLVRLDDRVELLHCRGKRRVLAFHVTHHCLVFSLWAISTLVLLTRAYLRNSSCPSDEH